MSGAKTDFDHWIDRRGSDSIKWSRYAGRDVLPMWVADMDFAAPPVVIAALQERVAQGMFGYGSQTAESTEAILQALARDYGWAVAPDWLVPLPGLVCGLNVAARTVGEPGDAILTTTPIYPPFMSAPRHQERETITVALAETAAGWTWDWAAMEAAVTPRTKAIELCHPHNPTGRVWRIDELERLAEFVLRHDLIVISDEIHCDLILEPGLRHQPLALAVPALASRCITLMAPSKTYNIAGLGASFAVIADVSLRRRFQRAMAGIVPHINVLGLVACAAAYAHGAAWRAELLDYLRGNRERVMQELDGYRGLRVTRPEATFLAWIDCRGAGIDKPYAFFEAAGVGLSDGVEFGLPGFVRLNFGCPRAMLDEALLRMKGALGKG